VGFGIVWFDDHGMLQANQGIVELPLAGEHFAQQRQGFDVIGLQPQCLTGLERRVIE
jgi:hypothetical protein